MNYRKLKINFFLISLNFITNFSLILKKKNNKKFNKIVLKNFLLFFFFFNFLKLNLILFKIKFFIKPSYFKIFNILRAPYRFKLSKTQLTFSRYFILCQLFFNEKLNFFFFKNLNQLIFFLKFFKIFFSFFEINFFFQKKINFKFFFY